MTLNQLLSETYALGFEDNKELTESFVFAANRAIRTINFELGDDKYGCINIASDAGVPVGSDEKTHNISDYIPDFLCASSPPFDAEKNKIDGASILGNTLILPSSRAGDIFFRYKALPDSITGDDLSAKIPLPKRCEHLCSILTAAYIWLDDEEEKATYYMQIYKEEAAKMLYTARRNTNADYHDVTGWAK